MHRVWPAAMAMVQLWPLPDLLQPGLDAAVAGQAGESAPVQRIKPEGVGQDQRPETAAHNLGLGSQGMSLMDLLDQLVNNEKWESDSYHRESILRPRWQAFFRRCCGKRMFTLWHRVRYQDAGKYPPQSRRARQWWGSKWGWVCAECGYREHQRGD